MVVVLECLLHGWPMLALADTLFGVPRNHQSAALDTARNLGFAMRKHKHNAKLVLEILKEEVRKPLCA